MWYHKKTVLGTVQLKMALKKMDTFGIISECIYIMTTNDELQN